MDQFTFLFENTTKGRLPENIQQLITAAEQATHDAYAPYSKFKVGAALLLTNGKIRTGANHENASYPAGICAERSVLASINPMDKEQQITAIAISYQSINDVDEPLSPCGICRQTILETQIAQNSLIAVYMCSPDGKVIYLEDAATLLPFSFSGKHLNVSVE